MSCRGSRGGGSGHDSGGGGSGGAVETGEGSSHTNDTAHTSLRCGAGGVCRSGRRGATRLPPYRPPSPPSLLPRSLPPSPPPSHRRPPLPPSTATCALLPAPAPALALGPLATSRRFGGCRHIVIGPTAAEPTVVATAWPPPSLLPPLSLVSRRCRIGAAWPRRLSDIAVWPPASPSPAGRGKCRPESPPRARASSVHVAGNVVGIRAVHLTDCTQSEISK